jgi:DNA-directed RNA polymerase specialized sigma24 family protein
MLEAETDADLLARYVEGRADDVFAELVRRYIGLVYHRALRQGGDAHVAEDVTQRVFILLAHKAGTDPARRGNGRAARQSGYRSQPKFRRRINH